MQFKLPLMRPIWLLTLTVLTTQPLLAETPLVDDSIELNPIELDPIEVVTASRQQQDRNQVMASISVISAEDIHLSVAQDLIELLRLEAGMDVVRTGSAGAQTSVFMRGGNSSHTLVLIDGMRVSSSHTGSYAWEHLPLNQIDRIEIVRGPRASMFGSDAMGGVIQIFTLKATDAYLSTTVGSQHSRRFEAGTGWQGEQAQAAVHTGWRKSGGISSQNAGGFSYDPDDDGFEARNIGIQAGGATGRGRWNLHVLASDNDVEFDQGISNTRQWFAGISHDGTLNQGLDYRLQASFADDQLSSDFGFFSSRFESKRWELSAQARKTIAAGKLTVGVDLVDESGWSEFNYDQDRDNRAMYAIWDRTSERFQWQISARLDDNSLFGSELTTQAAVGFAVGANSEIFALLGTAFRSPTLSEQFSPGFGGLFAGNPALKPESSSSSELIYRHQAAASEHWQLSLFHTDVDELIAYSGMDFQAVNIQQATMKGLELAYQNAFGPWQVQANATLQDTRDHSTGQSLLRRPDEKGSLSVMRHLPAGHWLGLEWFVSGKRLDFGAQLPGYAVFNAVAGWQISPASSVSLRLENITDHSHEPAAGFNALGRSVYLSLKWKP